MSIHEKSSLQAWAELLDYNEDDVRATLALRQYLRG